MNRRRGGGDRGEMAGRVGGFGRRPCGIVWVFSEQLMNSFIAQIALGQVKGRTGSYSRRFIVLMRAVIARTHTRFRILAARVDSGVRALVIKLKGGRGAGGGGFMCRVQYPSRVDTVGVPP